MGRKFYFMGLKVDRLGRKKLYWIFLGRKYLKSYPDYFLKLDKSVVKNNMSNNGEFVSYLDAFLDRIIIYLSIRILL